LIVVGAGVAIVLARRGTAAGVAALLLAGILLVIQVGDQWALTRYSAPLFAMLMVGGIEQRCRLARGVCLAATAMTPVSPLADCGHLSGAWGRTGSDSAVPANTSWC